MKNRTRVKVILFMTIVSVMITAAGDKIITQATSTKDKINQTENEKNALQGQLNESQENLEGLKNSQNSLKGELAGLKDDMTEISNNLEELEKKIAQKITEIEETQVALDEARATEEWQQECMVIRVREMYERNDTSYLNAIINAGSLSDMLNVADYFEKIASYDRGKLQEFIENRQYIEAQEALLESEKAEFENLKVAAEAEKNKVQGMISKTANSISKYADQISEEEQHALEIEAEIKRKEEDLVYLKQKLAEEMAMSQTAANSAWRDISEVSFAEGDRYLLANLIYCEAGGEPYAGQLGVGSVVINRVLSSVYPDSVVGVIYQNKQFSPVASGRLELALASNKATASCYKAADEAMAGVTNVGTCVYFRTPVEGLTGISIGGHIFY